MSTIKLDSDDLLECKEQLEKDLILLENEINAINISMTSISKQQTNKIELLIESCELNVHT
jgi:hypothetical protein